MDKKQKKTLFKTMGGVSASSILIASFTMQPTGSMKQAAEEYKISTAVSAIQYSSLAARGSLSSPIISKSTNNFTDSATHDNLFSYSPFSIPDYVSEGHQPIGYDAEGDEVDLITQEQTVQKEVTLSNGETYLETHGWVDDQGNYMDELPANASVGVENTPAEGNGDGLTYQQYTSRDNVTVQFTSGVPSDVIHNRTNSQSVNGPTKIWDASTSSWINVDTGTTSGEVGDGTGGNWTHLKSAASSWPAIGYNPWHGSNGSWNNAARLQYITWLWDYNLSSNATFYASSTISNEMGWNRATKLHSYLWGGTRTSWSRSMFIDYFYYAQAVYGNAFMADNIYCYVFRPTHTGTWFGQYKQLNTLSLSWMNIQLYSTSATMTGTISSIANRYPNGDGSGDYYNGSRDDDWTYVGPVFYSSNPTAYSGNTTIYGDTTSWSTSSTGSTIYDQNKVTYPALPINAEKQAVLGTNGPGVGDESGNTYYQGTITPSTTQRFTNAFTADSNPNWNEDEVNQVQVGDGSGRTYERALYYYDKDGNMLHDLPSGEFLYTEEDSADLFNSVSRSTNLDSTGSYEGVGIAETLSWISDNTDTLTIATDARAIASDLGIEFVVTETDTKQKRLLIAIQAAVEFLTGATSNTEVNDALVHFATIVDISDADRNAIASAVSSTSISSITNAVSEGYREDVQFFGNSFKIFGSSATTTKAATLLNSAELSEFFKISSDIGIYSVDAGSDVVYFDRPNGSIAEGQFGFASVTSHLDTENALLQNDLLQHFTLHDWAVGSVADRTHLSNVRYVDFDYDKKTMVVEIILHIGDKQEVLSELVSFTNSYMDQIISALALDEVIASADMLAEQPLITAAEYTVGSESDINANTASFALKDSFDARFPETVSIIDIVVPTPPTEDQTDVRYEFTVEYEGHTFVHSQFFTFDKTRSQKYVEDAIASINTVTSTVSIFDKTIEDLTSRVETFTPFDDFLIADGNTAARMSFTNVQLVGGGDIDRDATSMNITVDITMGTYSIPNVPLTLNLNHSVNEELINNLTSDDVVAKSPGIVAIVDDFDPTTPEWENNDWWKIQSSWLEMMDIAGIAVLGNFQKIDERHFEVDLEVMIGTHKKTIRVNQQVGFNLNFAPVLDETTTGISDPDTLAAYREYMLRFDEQASVFYIGNFTHAFIATAALESELLQAWEGTVATLSGDAVIRSVELTDINAITKYDRDVSFRITLEDSFGNTRTFDKITRFAISPVAYQFNDAVASMISTTQNLLGQLSDSVITQMQNIADYQWLAEHLDLLDTVRVVSVTNTGKTAHVVFEFGYSGHSGDDSKQVSIDYIFDRRGEKDLALANFGLGYTETELSNYYDINNVDALGNDWKNVEQSVLNELVKSAAKSTLRDDMEDEMKATHTSIDSNVWGSTVELQTAIEDITTTNIMALLQAEILAGGTTRTTFITNEWTELRNEKMEEMILSDLASNWKLNSSTDALNEVLKYNSTFDIKDNYLANVITIVENANFDVDISLEIAHATILEQTLKTTLQGVNQSTELDYYNAVQAATSNAFVPEYTSNISGTWTNTGELIQLIADATSQIIITNQVNATAGTITSNAHYNDRAINELVKDLTIFTDEEIKVVGYDVENAGALDRDASSFNIEVFMTFGSIVNQRHVFTLQLNKSINQAILDQIQTSDIELKDFLVQGLELASAFEQEADRWSTWEKFGLSSSHVLASDNLVGNVDATSFTIIGDVATSPRFSLDYTLTIGTTTINLTVEHRIGMDIIFDLSKVDPADTELLDYLRGYNVADRIDFDGTWEHPYQMLDAVEADSDALDSVLTLYAGLVASGIQIKDMYIHNRVGISEFSRTATLKIVAEDKNGDIKTFDKLLTFDTTAAEWAFSQFDESNIVLKDSTLTSGILTDAVKENILADKVHYDITNHRNPVHIDDPIVSHDGKVATVSWRVWYDDGLPGGASNSKTIEIQYDFASRGSRDNALALYGLEYADDASGLNIDWTNVDGSGKDWTNAEQNILDELVREKAEAAIRTELESLILNDAAEYETTVWASPIELQDAIALQTTIESLATLGENIINGQTTRDAFLTSVKQSMQTSKVEENILTEMMNRWNESSVDDLLTLIAQLNSVIDVEDYYKLDMHNVIKTPTYALDIARQMEIDTVRNNVLSIITVGLDPTDARFTIYRDTMNSKLDATYDTELAKGFGSILTLNRTIADSISQEAITSLLSSISSTINGTVTEDTRVIGDVYMNLGAFEQAGILHSNISIAGGAALDHDATSVQLTLDLTWGSATNNGTAITMNLNQTVATAMIDAIQFDEIGLLDQRLASEAADIDVNNLTSDLFGIFSRHILGSDNVTLTIDTATFVADPIEPRDFHMDVTITIGGETRVITIRASVGFDINLDWESIDWATATDDEKDMIDFMDNYDFQNETEYFGLHSNPFELSSDQHLLDSFSPSRKLTASKGVFTQIVIKDPSSITKYDRSLTITVTIIDKNGVTYEFDKEISLPESYMETTLKAVNDSHFNLDSSIQLTDMLTDSVVSSMSVLSAYDIDVITGEFDVVELLTLQQSGKTATATFRVAYDDGGLNSGSKIITKSFEFISRGSKDDSVANFGLGFNDSQLGIDWNSVDTLGNDWTNVEQVVLDNLVMTMAYNQVRLDTRTSITINSTGYVNNVFGSINNLDMAISEYASNEELEQLQANISNNSETRAEWLAEATTHLQTSNVERMILEALASDWRVIDSKTALEKAGNLQPGFDITTYYSNIHALVLDSSFDIDQARQIGYDIFSGITRDLMDVSNTTVDTNRDIHYDNVHGSMFETKYNLALNESWSGVNEFADVIADMISSQYIDDEISKMAVSVTGYPSVFGTVDRNTRTLDDVAKDFGLLQAQYIDVTNIRLTSNGIQLDGDVDMEHIYAGISFGSIINQDSIFTLELSQTINFAIIEAIDANDIRMTEYRIADSTASVNPDDILPWMFKALSPHIRSSDTIVVSLDATNPFTPEDIATDPHRRRYTIGITISVGNEERRFLVSESVGQMIVFGTIDSTRWTELGILGAADEADFITYNNNYPYEESIIYAEDFDHVMDVQAATKQEWTDALSLSQYVIGGGMTIADVDLKDNGTYTKYDKEFTLILTLEDSWGDTRIIEKTIALGNSAVEFTMLLANETSFGFTDHDNTTAMLTDNTLENILTDRTSYFIDSDITRYLDVSNPIVTYEGKTATVGFEVSFDDGSGYTGSQIVKINIEFVSRGSKDDAIADFGLGYDDARLGINWNSVDAFANDWTNVEQSVLDDLVRTAAMFEIRFEINDSIIGSAVEYISHVWASQLELAGYVENETTYANLDELQAEISNGSITRDQFVTQIVEELKVNKIESLLLEKMATLWRLDTAHDAKLRAQSIESSFDIKDYYYSNMDGVIKSVTFIDSIAYEAIENIYRADVDSMMLASAQAADQQKVTEAIDAYIDEKIKEVFQLNIWSNDSSIVSHISYLISEQAISDAMTFVNSTVTGTIDRDTRNISDVNIDLAPLEYEGLYLSNVQLNGSTNGEFIDRDTTSLDSSVSITFGTIVDRPYLISVDIGQTLNQTILDALTSSSFTIINGNRYASVDYMLETMGEDLANGGSGTIQHATYFESTVSFLGRNDANISMDPNNPLQVQAGSSRIFTIGLLVQAGVETRELEVTIQVGESIDFTLPEFGPGGVFDFNPYFIMTTTAFNNPYDLHQAGDEALNHIGIDSFLESSNVTLESMVIAGNDNVDIFSREYVATFTLRDRTGNLRMFIDQPVVIPGNRTKAEIIMTNSAKTDITLADSSILTGQLTDDLLTTGLHDFATYSFGNDLELLNDLQVKEVTHLGKTVSITFIVGYNDGAGNEDHIEYTYIYSFAYRADVAWSLYYYGLDMTTEQLGITFTDKQADGDVEQVEIDTIVIDALRVFLFNQYEGDLQTFVDAGIFTSTEMIDAVNAFLDEAKIDEIASDGQVMDRDDVIEKHKADIITQTAFRALDSISVSLLKANDWTEVATRFPSVTTSLEASITESVADGTFVATNIESILAGEVAIAIAPDVQNIATVGAAGLPGWWLQFIGDDKAGFMWNVHSTVAAQLSAGFDDAPELSPEVSHIHVNNNSVNGWFLDEISQLVSFAALDDYIIHLSTVLARVEVPAQITDEQLAIARSSLKNNISNDLQDLIDEGILTLEDIDKYLDVLLYVDHDHEQGYPDANFDAVFSPDKYFIDEGPQIIIEQLTHTANELATDSGFSSLGEFASKTATYIVVAGQNLSIEQNDARYTTSETVDEYRDMHKHYILVLKNNVYEEAYEIYQNDAEDNVVSSLMEFLASYVSKMDVHLSGLDGIDYDDQANLETQAAFIANRVDQIQNKPDIAATIITMLDNIGLDGSAVDDTPYKDLLKFTITHEELYDHLYSQAMEQILEPGGIFEWSVDNVGQQGNPLTDTQIARAKVILDELMTEDYPTDSAGLDMRINTAIIFAIVDEDFYVHIISRYNEFTQAQDSGAPTWNPIATTDEAKAALEPVLDQIFKDLLDGTLLIGDAMDEILSSRDEIAANLAWEKYEEAFRDIFEQLRVQDQALNRMTIEEIEEYATLKILKPSLAYYIQELADSDRASGTLIDVPSTADMLVHLEMIIDEAIDYAQERFDQLLDEIAEVSKATRQDVMVYSSIMEHAIELTYDGYTSYGGTSTEIKALRAQLGKYVFELIIEVTEKPDPEQNLNGWLIPFAAMITKTEDYSKISQIIQDKIDAGEEIDYENWGFENVADIMDALIDSTEDQETYNAATGKILMDKFIRSVDSSSNKWSTTMWMGPVPLRMTYGRDGNIASMQTVLMDREDAETITSIGLSTHYNQEELTLRLGMEDGTTVYIRYVEDADGNINVILQRLDSEGNWLTSEMYREQDTNEVITKKNYQIFRDSNLDSFEGIGSEFEDEMITIFGESPVTAQMSINESTTRNTVDHVWGTNPTVGSSTDTGDAESARALVTKDDAGKTHIQMHQKDIRITNVTNSMTASITAGGFTLMWLIWTFLGGFLSLGSFGAGSTMFALRRKERKQAFTRKYPHFAGASTLTVVRLKQAMRKRDKAHERYIKALKELEEDFDGVEKNKPLLDLVEVWSSKVLALESVAWAEAEASKYKKVFSKNVKTFYDPTVEKIDRAARIPDSLEQRTTMAIQLAAGGRFVQNNVQQTLVKKHDNGLKKTFTTEPEKTDEVQVITQKVAIKEVKGATIRQIEETLSKLKELKTSSVVPMPTDPTAGIDFTPLTKMGISVKSAIFKRAAIDKNVKEQTLALILMSGDREFVKDIKVNYKRSVNEDILQRLDEFELDITRLKRFDFTSDKGFDEAGIMNLFKVNAPGATTRLVRGSLEITTEKDYSGKLEITVGKLSAVIPFKAQL